MALGTTEILTHEEVSITVKMRLTDGIISSSRNAANHIYFNWKHVASWKITCIYKSKNGEYTEQVINYDRRERVAVPSTLTP